ncbi:MAG: WGR domain-containing protein, partial [Flavobacteriales bacterium]|nr:WGR domain-containing protein [Flavobacteriales bacterium]
EYLRKHDDGAQLILSLIQIHSNLKDLVLEMEPLMKHSEKYSLGDIKSNLLGLRSSLSILPEIIPSLQELLESPSGFVDAVKNIPMNNQEAEAAFGRKSLQSIYRTNRYLTKIEGRLIEQRLNNIGTLYEQLFDLNAEIVKGRVRENFIDHINISSQSASTLSTEQRKFKKSYSAGRKKIEHEFNKVMRYKPIRELVSTESGQVIKDLKPVWLMSPLSVSDTLPVSTDNFDVVIFDEASQITLEEGIPSIYRAKQAIIVGDEMQMPPTKFFSSKGVDTDDLDQEETEFEEVELDADSLLSQAARNLSSRMLGWHYRSRHEALIGFSNAAFYGNNLLTIPDNKIASKSLNEIVIENDNERQPNVDAIFDRSISFHKLETSVYESRTNLGEAKYIAHLVRRLLVEKKKGLSIGIVAFSKEQQLEIENALTDLAAADQVFQTALDKEYERVEDDQFVGLIIKNLENIQGDERDIIIMSVCYGYNSKGKMLMNFGPINRNGGEKRLNVIFSRAKKHMAIISSIRHYDIKNEYNEGANYFRKFLQYAESISKGNLSSANLTLKSLSKSQQVLSEDVETDVVTKTIAKKLQEKGYHVELSIGQSYFKCSIGVSAKSGLTNYQLGILVDDGAHYENKNILEQYYLRPSILKSFGWNLIQVYSKDWYKNEEMVFNRILRLLGESIKEEVEEAANGIEIDITATEDQVLTSEDDSQSAIPVIENTKDIKAVSSAEEVSIPKEIEPVAVVVEAKQPKVKKPSTAKKDKKPVKKKATPKKSAAPNVLALSKTKEENYISNPAFNYSNSQYFEFADDTSFKFWEVAQNDINVGVRYGRIKTKGQVQLKTFESSEQAKTEMEKLIKSKTRKGYNQVF